MVITVRMFQWRWQVMRMLAAAVAATLVARVYMS